MNREGNDAAAHQMTMGFRKSELMTRIYIYIYRWKTKKREHETNFQKLEMVVELSSPEAVKSASLYQLSTSYQSKCKEHGQFTNNIISSFFSNTIFHRLNEYDFEILYLSNRQRHERRR